LNLHNKPAEENSLQSCSADILQLATLPFLFLGTRISQSRASHDLLVTGLRHHFRVCDFHEPIDGQTDQQRNCAPIRQPVLSKQSIPLSYAQARRFVAKKEYDEAIAAFQEILRHYPEEKEPYSQIIWIANLTGQTEIAENFSRKFQERFE
jgi:hypothetical protein